MALEAFLISNRKTRLLYKRVFRLNGESFNMFIEEIFTTYGEEEFHSESLEKEGERSCVW
ncbi:hypothetical protein B6A27_17565 [Anoxybacillus sp. UARK-01]|nr:hypothetical protein B6A27_17565 [Anoxybacillus sp. UARK-01]